MGRKIHVIRRSEHSRSLSDCHVRSSYATGPLGYPTPMPHAHRARSSSPRSSLRAPRATSPTSPHLSPALDVGSAQDDVQTRRSSRERSCDACCSTRSAARGQQSTRAANAAHIRGASMHGRAVRAQLTESFQRICAVSMESARRRRNTKPPPARKPDKLSEEQIPPT